MGLVRVRVLALPLVVCSPKRTTMLRKAVLGKGGGDMVRVRVRVLALPLV